VESAKMENVFVKRILLDKIATKKFVSIIVQEMEYV
jgi:hypothetical protein